MSEESKAWTPARRAFVEFFLRAGDSPDVVNALAEAAPGFGVDARRALAEAIASDSDDSGSDPSAALLALLSTEVDVGVAARIAELLGVRVGRFSRRLEDESVAWGCLDADHGGVVLAHALHHDLVEVFCLSWRNDQIQEARFEPLAVRADVDRLSIRIAESFRLRQLSWACAVDCAAERIWRHLRCGGDRLPALSSFSRFLR